MPIRAVRRSDRFVAAAKRLFPDGCRPDGTPSYIQLEEGPLRGAEAQLGRQFDDLPPALDPGIAIKAVMTAPVPLFPAMVFYAVLGDDGVVELVDIIIDPDYFDLLESDPDD